MNCAANQMCTHLHLLDVLHRVGTFLLCADEGPLQVNPQDACSLLPTRCSLQLGQYL